MPLAGNLRMPQGFALQPNEDATILELSVEPSSLPAMNFKRLILDSAREMKLKAAIDEAAIDAAIAAASAGNRSRVAIAKGTAPVDGADGRLVWSKNLLDQHDGTSRRSHYLGRIEKRVVHKGAPLAKLLSETRGVDGTDVFGKSVKATDGRALKIKAGANVHQEGQVFFAAADGMVRLNGGALVVDQVFIAEKTLDFEIGNIDFPGSVIVHGGVLDLFEIKATGAVQIEGLVEAANITAGGDIEVKAGVAGKKKGVLRTQGGVSAKYLLNAHVYARSDVTVETQAIASTVMTLGALRMPKGTVTGGDVVALAGIQADTIGSDNATPTSVAAGINYTLEGIDREAEEVIADCRKRLATVDAAIADLKEVALTPQIRERMTELNASKSELEGRIEKAEAHRKEATAFTHRVAVPVILVQKAIYPGVTVRLGDCKSVVGEALAGPLKLVGDRNSGTVRFLRGS